MTSNSQVKQFADQLTEIYERMADAKLEADAVIDAAKAAGMDQKDISALRKIGKEMLMPVDKLAAKYDAEQQLEMFRDVVGIRRKKGLTRSEPLSEIEGRRAAP